MTLGMTSENSIKGNSIKGNSIHHGFNISMNDNRDKKPAPQKDPPHRTPAEKDPPSRLPPEEDPPTKEPPLKAPTDPEGNNEDHYMAQFAMKQSFAISQERVAWNNHF